MTTLDPGYDVVIIGGGVAGCASAYHLAPDHDVALLEKGQIAGEASGLAAGLVAPTLFYGDHPNIAEYANEWFRAFDGTWNFSYRQRPRIEFIQTDSEELARDRAADLADAGFPVTFLDPADVEQEYPWFDATQFAGAVEYADAGWVDPYEYTVALQKAAEERGGDVYTNTPVSDVTVEDGGAEVEVPQQSVAADYVVLATGWRTRDLLADRVTLPTQPFRLQCGVLRLEEPLDGTFPLGRVAREDLYFREQRNGDLLVGGGEYLADTPEQVASGAGIDDEFRQHVAMTVPTFMNGADRAEFVDGWSGIDAATPDTLPLLGSPSALPDALVIATGFNGLGMVNSPIAAAAVRSYVTGTQAPFSSDQFAVDRFPDGAVDFELRGTFEMEGAGR